MMMMMMFALNRLLLKRGVNRNEYFEGLARSDRFYIYSPRKSFIKDYTEVFYVIYEYSVHLG
jgi:hypothetical protein